MPPEFVMTSRRASPVALVAYMRGYERRTSHADVSDGADDLPGVGNVRFDVVAR